MMLCTFGIAASATATSSSGGYDVSAPAMAGCEAFPRMPLLSKGSGGHRDKIPDCPYPFSACVARPVGRKEIAQEPKAQAAVKAEWDLPLAHTAGASMSSHSTKSVV